MLLPDPEHWKKHVVFACRLLRIIDAQLTLVVKEELMVVDRRGMF